MESSRHYPRSAKVHTNKSCTPRCDLISGKTQPPTDYQPLSLGPAVWSGCTFPTAATDSLRELFCTVPGGYAAVDESTIPIDALWEPRACVSGLGVGGLLCEKAGTSPQSGPCDTFSSEHLELRSLFPVNKSPTIDHSSSGVNLGRAYLACSTSPHARSSCSARAAFRRSPHERITS
jgi:hypothetical protein